MRQSLKRKNIKNKLKKLFRERLRLALEHQNRIKEAFDNEEPEMEKNRNEDLNCLTVLDQIGSEPIFYYKF